jgi:hypothetical protein
MTEFMREWGIWIFPFFYLLSAVILFWILNTERKKRDARWESYTEEEKDWILWKRMEARYGAENVMRGFRAYQSTISNKNKMNNTI